MKKINPFHPRPLTIRAQEVINPKRGGHLLGDETTLPVTNTLWGMLSGFLTCLIKPVREEMAKAMAFQAGGKL